jgi:hypothetical protein
MLSAALRQAERILKKWASTSSSAPWSRPVEPPCGAALWSRPVEPPCGAALWSRPVEPPCGAALWSRPVEPPRGTEDRPNKPSGQPGAPSGSRKPAAPRACHDLRGLRAVPGAERSGLGSALECSVEWMRQPYCWVYQSCRAWHRPITGAASSYESSCEPEFWEASRGAMALSSGLLRSKPPNSSGTQLRYNALCRNFVPEQPATPHAARNRRPAGCGSSALHRTLPASGAAA